MWTLVPVNICCHVIVPREWLVVIIQYIDKVRLAITVGEPWIVDFLSDKQARVTERLVMPLHDSALQVRPWNKLPKFVQKSLHSFDISKRIQNSMKLKWYYQSDLIRYTLNLPTKKEISIQYLYELRKLKFIPLRRDSGEKYLCFCQYYQPSIPSKYEVCGDSP